MMGRLPRICAAHLLAAGVADRRIRVRHARDLLVLAFHNVVPDDAPSLGNRSLHLPLSKCLSLIDQLLELCSAVQLGDSRAIEGRPRFVVTFDDAYRGPSPSHCRNPIADALRIWIDAPAGSRRRIAAPASPFCGLEFGNLTTPVVVRSISPHGASTSRLVINSTSMNLP